LVLGALLAVIVIGLERLTDQPWQPTVLDLAACGAAAATRRWPRAAGTALGCILVVYIFIPPPWATMGEYALMIPILCSGIRGRRRLRAVMSVCYFAILAAMSVADASPGRSPVLGWIAWGALIGVLWLIGNVFLAWTTAQQKSREAELVLQRQSFARQLHDTVARSLTQVAMVAERARLRGSASGADLELIAETSRKAHDELRLLMALLREPTGPKPDPDANTQPVEAALAAARTLLTRAGFQASLVVQGSPDRLAGSQAAAMTNAIEETTANIIKHAEPESPCGIVFDVDHRRAELMVVNRRPSTPAPTHPVSMGLDTLKSTVSALGGAVLVDGELDSWTTRVTMPLMPSDARPALEGA